MKTGVIFPSLAKDVTYAAVTGAWSAAYPLLNAKDIIHPSNVARASGTGSRTISGTFPAVRSIKALAIVGHNVASLTALCRLYLFSGTGNDPVTDAATLIYDSGAATKWWPTGSAPVSLYRAIRPFILSAAMSVRSFRLVMEADATLQFSSIEVGGFWEWPGISPGRELGVRPEDVRYDLVGGASSSTGRGAPRLVKGQIDLLKMSITSTTGLDFQTSLDKQKPFVWAEDFDDPATWARKCILVRNEEVPPMVGALYRHDRFPIRLVEHFR